MTELFLEDFAVGQRFISNTRAVTADEIKTFAASFDPQPFHTDEAAAKASFFRGLAASGWHTAGITMSLLVKSGMPIAGGLIGAGAEIEWPKPVRPGDVLQVESEVLAVTPSRSRPERGMITVKSLSRSVAQPGSALVWGTRGRRFKSCRSDHYSRRVLEWGTGEW